MLKERHAAAKAVANQLFISENEIDNGLASASALVIAMVEARKTLKLSATVGQAALDHAGRSLSALVDARRELVAAHGALAETRTEVRMDDWDLGTGGGKPPLKEMGKLRLVGEA